MHKPLPVLRSAHNEGGTNGSTSAGDADAAGMAAPTLRKRDIPTPVIATVEGYENEQTSNYRVPDGYIRFPRRAAGEDDVAACEYTLEMQDEVWLNNHKAYGLAAPTSERDKLGGDRLERMLGILERATGQADCIPLSQAETLFVSKLGMSKAEHHHAWSEVYKYWKEKRAKLGKPLLRRFWPVTSPNDTDPHKVFRPREKERYKLRKHRKNDLDSFRKLQQVKKDFEKLLNITRMIQKREVMKREQLMVQQEIFLQQHWDLTDTTGEARPLTITPGRYRARPRQPTAAATTAAAATSEGVGAAAGASTSQSGAAPPAAQPVERVREDRERRKSKKRKERDRERASRSSEARAEAAGEGAGEDEEDGGEFSGGGAAGSGVGREGTGVIPGSYVSVLPSFMDELKTRARIPVRTVVEPALAVYSVNGQATTPREKAKSGGKGVRKARVGLEPVYKFQLRGRIGRGGRVIWDRVPVKGAQPLRDDGLADPEEAPLVVHSSYVQFPFKPPAAHVLHPPMVNLNADERRYREICAMDDDQEEMLEPLGLGLTNDSSSSAAAAAAPGTTATGSAAADPGSGARMPAPKVKYALEV